MGIGQQVKVPLRVDGARLGKGEHALVPELALVASEPGEAQAGAGSRAER